MCFAMYLSKMVLGVGCCLDLSCKMCTLLKDRHQPMCSLYWVMCCVGGKSINAELASMVAAEFSQQYTLNGVTQAVVDKIVRVEKQ